jgi:hypothetical protein
MGSLWRVKKDCSKNLGFSNGINTVVCDCTLLKNVNIYEKIADKKTFETIRKNISENELEKWTDADKIVVFVGGIIGMILDTLITQTNILKPLDKYISNKMKSENIIKFKDLLDNYSKSFRKGDCAPIDFQEFEMFGPKSIHAQYSFGHDPLRFVEGILQILSGEYRGVDKFGDIKKSMFGTPVDGIFQAVISYIAHMISDFCNVRSLPYPGTTYLMEWGNDDIRKALSVAFRNQLYNSRVFIYQNLELLVINIIIYGWAIYDTYVRERKINLLAGNMYKYQTMLLASYAMPCGTNITITGIRALITENPHELFRLNFPVIFNTIGQTLKILKMKLNK